MIDLKNHTFRGYIQEINFSAALLSKLEFDNEHCNFSNSSYFINKINEIIIYKLRRMAKNKLSEKNFKIFSKYFFENWNQDFIATFYNLSQAAVSKRLKRSIIIIKENLEYIEFLLN